MNDLKKSTKRLVFLSREILAE